MFMARCEAGAERGGVTLGSPDTKRPQMSLFEVFFTQALLFQGCEGERREAGEVDIII